MRYLYFDILDGISGDMIVAALLELSSSIEYLKKELKKIRLEGFRIKLIKIKSNHFKAVRFCVQTINQNKEKIFQFSQIKKIIKDSDLKKEVKDNVLRIYQRLYNSERNVHAASSVHFHQVGELDSVIDIVSACIILDYLKIDQVYYSVIGLGHKVASATLDLLKGQDIFFSEKSFENVTPTAAAIITTLGRQRRYFTNMARLEKVAYSTGSIQVKDSTNILRAVLFSDVEILDNRQDCFDRDEVIEIQTLIDDSTPQVIADLMNLVYQAGALEAYTLAVTTKKSRVGLLFSVLSKPETFDKIVELIFRHTTTLGLRYQSFYRLKLKRKEGHFRTDLGNIAFKKTLEKKFKKLIPEYEDCVRAARLTNQPLRDIILKIQNKRNANGPIRIRDI